MNGWQGARARDEIGVLDWAVERDGLFISVKLYICCLYNRIGLPSYGRAFSVRQCGT